MSADILPEDLAVQAPAGHFRVDKKSVLVYFIGLALLISYMLWTLGRLDVSGAEPCGAYNVSTIAHAEETFAWAFVNPGGNVSQRVAVVCGGLEQSTAHDVLPMP